MFTLTFSLDSVAWYALSANLLVLCAFVLVVYAAKKKRALAQAKIIDFVTLFHCFIMYPMQSFSLYSTIPNFL